jgi:type VI secretion system protein ImpG
MRDDLLIYYENELDYLRHLAAEFAEKYPKVASRLVLEPTQCEDPHVERLLEGFAFLAARVHLKLDDELPEMSEALLSIVYPHLIRPIPSMSIVQFEVDLEQGKLTTGLPIARNSTLYSRPVDGAPCLFRTCYETVLWPVSVTAAEWRTPDRLQPPVKAFDANGAVRLELRAGADTKFPSLQMDRLRFYLDGESTLVHRLYELLCSRLVRIIVRDPTPASRVKPVALPATAFRPVGFEDDEAMLPYDRRSFTGYRLLQEYFTFPEKFFFFDLVGLQAAWATGFDNAAELIFLFSDVPADERTQRLEMGVSAGTFRLGCTPIINLFKQAAEPILLDQLKYEYPIIPDVRRPNATEVFSVDEVVSIDPNTQQTSVFQPFYSFRHGSRADKQQCFWLAKRRQSERRDDDATDMFISLIDLSMRAARPEARTLTVRTTCTNRDLPSRLPFGSKDGDFELEGGASIRRIMTLRRPTAPLRPEAGKGALWRLISHLSLNYLSLVAGGQEALQEILKLYNFSKRAELQKQIEGIVGLKSDRHFARIVSDHGISFARGTRVEMELDEEQFVGGGVYLFASIIENFLAHYVSLNSFSQLVVSTRQRKEVLREWPPRAGRQIIM